MAKSYILNLLRCCLSTSAANLRAQGSLRVWFLQGFFGRTWAVLQGKMRQEVAVISGLLKNLGVYSGVPKPKCLHFMQCNRLQKPKLPHTVLAILQTVVLSGSHF